MTTKEEDRRRSSHGATGRAARLEAELKANLRRRKEQARARAQTKTSDPGAQAPENGLKPTGEDYD